ncbi:MAG: hypothetical protein ACRYGG_18730 [Janthinobacterium lividum]
MSKVEEFDALTKTFFSKHNLDNLKRTLECGENIDGEILNIISKLDAENDCRPYIGLQSVGAKFKKQTISASKLDLIIKIYDEIINKHNWIGPIQSTLAISEGLPFTKLFFDLDCKCCKNKISHPGDGQQLKKEWSDVVFQIYDFVCSIFKEKLECFITTKQNKPYCGTHMFFMVNIDVAIKHLVTREVMNRLKLLRFIIDKTTNVVLPLSRNHLVASQVSRDGNEIKPLDWSLETMRKLSYIDVWNLYDYNWVIRSTNIESLEEATELDNFLKLHLYLKGLPVKVILYENVVNIFKSKDGTNTYQQGDYGINFDTIHYRDTKNGPDKIIIQQYLNFHQISRQETKKVGVTIVENEEYYQQMPAINFVTSRATEVEPMVVDTVHEYDDSDEEFVDIDDIFNVNLSKTVKTKDVGVDKRFYYYLNFSSDDLRLYHQILTDGLGRMSKSDARDIERAIAHDLEPFDRLYTLMHFEFPGIERLGRVLSTIAEECEMFKKGGSKNKKRKTEATAPNEKSDSLTPRNLLFNEADLEYLNSLNIGLKYLIPMALKTGNTLATISFLSRNTKIPLDRLLHLLIYNFHKVASRESIYTILRILSLPMSNMESFFNNNFQGNPFMYMLFNDVTKSVTSPTELTKIIFEQMEQRMFNNLRRDLGLRFILKHVLVVRTMGDSYVLFNGQCHKKFIKLQAKVLFEKTLKITDIGEFYDVEVYLPPTHSLNYAHFTSRGIYNPLFGVYEPANPTLNSFIMRLNEDLHKKDETTLYITPRQYAFHRDLHFKIYHFIKMVWENTVSFVLTAPLFCPKVPTSVYMDPPIEFCISNCNIQPEDFNAIMKFDWRANFITRLKSADSLLGQTFNVFMGIMGIADKNYYIQPRAPMQFVYAIFGRSDYEMCGTSKYIFKDGKYIFQIKNEKGQDEDVDMDDDEEEIDAPIDINQFVDDVELSVFNENLLKYIKSIRIEKEVDVETVVEKKYLLEDSYKHDTSIIKPHITKLNMFEIINNVTLTPNFRFNFEKINEDYLKFCILIFSWFLRLGKESIYATTPFVKEMFKRRIQLYKEFADLVYDNYEDIRVMSSHDLALQIKKFDERTRLDYSEMRVAENMTVEELNIPDIEHEPHIKKLLAHQGPNREYTVEEKIKFYNLAAYMVSFSNFNYDNYIEFTKISASALYAGNYNKLFYNIYGRSNAGKSAFLDVLFRALLSQDGDKILNPRYSAPSNQENNVNAPVLGRSLIAVLDESKHFIYIVELKRDVNIGHAVTRTICATDREAYYIVAKFFITNNYAVRSLEGDDDGFTTRMYPINLTHNFCGIKDSISRYDESNLLITTDVLAFQLLANKYPQGTAIDVSLPLALSIIHFYSKFYFNTCELPTSKTMTPTVLSTRHRYLTNTSPYYHFCNTVKIIPSDKALSIGEINDIINKWLQSKPQFAAKVKTPQLLETLISRVTDDINKFNQGGNYMVSFIC